MREAVGYKGLKTIATITNFVSHEKWSQSLITEVITYKRFQL